MISFPIPMRSRCASQLSFRRRSFASLATTELDKIFELASSNLRFGSGATAEVGEDLGMHATTISRAVAGKYIFTPHGMIEMRAFFATGYQTSSGAEFSNAAVRDAIQTLIQQENPKKPLSDDALTKALNANGIDIKRRTVAKYREQLHILPSHLRKR